MAIGYCRFVLLVGLFGFVGTQNLKADQFHYNNILIGDRALGLGGAYGAVSDDATGIYYNPAGLGFALSNDVSGSANAYYGRKTTYKKAVGDIDFQEKSDGSTPSFFGGLQKLDRISKGLVFAFGLYTTDNDLKDQDDLIEGMRLGSVNLYRFHRTVNQRASTLFAGAGLAKRFGSGFSLGLSVNYVKVDELVQEYQDVKQTALDGSGRVLTDSNGNNFVSIFTQNTRQRLTASGLQGVVGAQYAAGKFSFGLTAKGGSWLAQKFDVSVEGRRVIIPESDNQTLDSQKQAQASASLVQILSGDENETPLGSMPSEFRASVAWFASPRFLWVFDTTYHGEVSDADTITPYKKTLFSKEAVTNFATGVEYYVLPSMPVRLGVFTNNDARPEVEKGMAGQLDHVDFIGESIFLAWVQPNNQFTAGVVLQQGEGKAQKLGDSQIQEVEATSVTFAFAATASF